MKNIILILLNLLIISNPLNAIARVDYTSGSAQISFDEWGQCSLENEKVSCTGDYAIDMPLFNKPSQISVGYKMACAIDDKRVKCWGKKNTYYPTLITNITNNAPVLIDPTHVSVGSGFVCVIDESKVKCWGEDIKTEVKNSHGFSYINVNYNTICALLSGSPEADCWQNYKDFNNSRLPRAYAGENFKTGFYGFSYISKDIYTSKDIVVHAMGPKASGHGIPTFNYFYLPVKNPKYLGFLSGEYCVVDDEGKICREEPDGYLGPEKKEDYVRYFSIRLAIRTLPLNKKRFLEPLMKFDNYFCIKTMEVCVELLSTIISPLILTHDSKYHQDELIPKFKKWKTSLDIIEINDNLENRKIAITAIQSSLEVSLSFLSGHQIDRTQDALRKAGQAMIDPMNNQNILEAVKSVESLTEERAVLLSSDKSKFLIECQQVALDWLKLKVK